jgi:hypothetical protein
MRPVLILIVFLFFIGVAGCSKKQEVAKVSDTTSLVQNFFILRKAGDTDSAWYLLSEKTRKYTTIEQFKKYCFVYKVIDFSIKDEKDGFYKISYSFFDKKMNKKGKLHNYFITKADEYISVDDGGVVFPHVGFLTLRDAIKQKDMERAKRAITQMLELSPKQPEVLETAKNMGLM